MGVVVAAPFVRRQPPPATTAASEAGEAQRQPGRATTKVAFASVAIAIPATRTLDASMTTADPRRHPTIWYWDSALVWMVHRANAIQ